MKKIFYLVLFSILFSTLNVFAKEIKIVQITDIGYSVAQEEQEENIIAENLEKFIKEMNHSDIDLVVFSGDMVAKSKKENIESFIKITKQLKKPYYFVLGENDVHKASGVKKEDFMRYANYHNPYMNSESPNYSVKLSNKLTMIVLDGASPVVKNTHGYYGDKTVAWLGKQLSKNKKKEVVIFQHFPIAPPEENYKYETLNTEAYIDTIKKYDNILFIASGHFNKDIVIPNVYGTKHVSTPAFGKEPYSYRKFVINDRTGEVTTKTEKL